MANPSTPIAYATSTSVTEAEIEYTPNVANTRMAV